MKKFITKYALTTGIIECDVELSGNSWWTHRAKYLSAYKLNEVYDTLEEALVAVEAMRQRKIVSLEKQLKKFVDMDINKIKINQD